MSKVFISARIERAKKKGDKHAVSRISGYWRVPVKTAYDWLYKWDGTWKSLMVKSHRPHRHPNQHTEVEIAMMVSVTREFGFLPPLLMYQELVERGYPAAPAASSGFFGSTSLRLRLRLFVRKNRRSMMAEPFPENGFR